MPFAIPSPTISYAAVAPIEPMASPCHPIALRAAISNKAFRPKAELFDQLYLIFLLAARLIVLAEFVFVMRQCIRCRLKRYVTKMYNVG